MSDGLLESMLLVGEEVVVGLPAIDVVGHPGVPPEHDDDSVSFWDQTSLVLTKADGGQL